jgi:MFS family permease
VMQATGIAGRIVIGWAADRLGSGRRTLFAATAASALTSLVMATASPDWPFAALLALVAIAGVTVSSWNGVQLAEIAALSPRDRIAEASAGATVVIFVGYTVAPAAFAVLLAAGGRWDLGYVLTAAVTALGLLGLRRT